MLDFSFIRLEPDFTKAKYESIPAVTDLGYFNQIVLHPRETYLQITNTVLGIAFAGNYEVTIIDCSGSELLDITENVAISEFIDNNGVNQIAFEIVNINSDFYQKTVYLKFRHTASDYTWYSNGVIISEYHIRETTRFDYRNYTEFHGLAYNIADYYQSIRLRCRFETNDSESQSKQYTSIDGIKVTSRLIETELENYIFEEIDNFTYRRLNKLLSHQVVYVNGNRMTNKQTIGSDERLGESNLFNLKFKIAVNYKETFTDSFQIFEPLTLTFYAPEGYFTLTGLPTTINGTFNRDVTEVSGTMDLIDNSDDSIIHSYPISEITTISNLISANLAPYILANGNYKIRINSGVFVSSLFGEVFEGFEWDFIVSDPDFLAADFNSLDFFTS